MMALHRETAASCLVLFALAVYIAGELVFRYSAFSITFPSLTVFKPVLISECVAIAAAIVAIVLFPKPVSMWVYLSIAAVLSILLISSGRTDDYRLVCGFVLLISIAGIKPERVFLFYGITVLSVVSVLILMSVSGFLVNKDIIPNSRLVFSYGFIHPNGLGACLFAGIGALTIACWHKRSWLISFVIAIAGSLFAFFILSSHTSSAVLAVLAVIILIGRIARGRSPHLKHRNLYFFIAVLVPTVFLLFTFFATMLYDGGNPLFAQADSLLHSRLKYANAYYIDNNGFTILGREYVGRGTNYHNGLSFYGVDSGYCKLMLIYGLLSLLVLFVIYVVAVWKLSHLDELRFISVLIVLSSLYLLFEGYQLDLATGFGALLLSAAFIPLDDIKEISRAAGVTASA